VNNFDLVDPGLRPVLEFVPNFDLVPEHLPAIRELVLAMVQSTPGLDASGTCEEMHIDGLDGAPAIRILVYKPRGEGKLRSAILDIHGGGYVMGCAEMARPEHWALLREFGCVIVSVDYRLAPDTAYPGALEDCYAALKWMHANAEGLGLDKARIGVSGVSAGGGLAAALALYVRDKGEQLLSFQHLMCPMLDDRTCTRPNVGEFVGNYVWTKVNNVFGWTSLLGKPPGTADVPPYAAPARAKDLSRLPQAFIAVGALDLFIQEDLEYGSRLAQAGVPVELHVYAGAFHGFQLAQDAPITRIAERDSRAAIRKFLKVD
jgi:triacylglycerol lipase